MRNLESNEMLEINGGHDGTAYNWGVATGEYIREIAADVADGVREAWDAFSSGVVKGLTFPF
ncbi:hypothetical protein [Maribacter sp. 2307ULW6-5]|uniref:hypothetical protein n=1 Tax=Maribacter sp. 2307ULW6-5 TaxID=3386275 RepID=UPI0039BD6182